MSDVDERRGASQLQKFFCQPHIETGKNDFFNQCEQISQTVSVGVENKLPKNARLRDETLKNRLRKADGSNRRFGDAHGRIGTMAEQASRRQNAGFSGSDAVQYDFSSRRRSLLHSDLSLQHQ